MIAIRLLIATAWIALCASGAMAGLIEDLKRDQDKIEKALVETRAEYDKLAGGLLKSLIATRLELLRTNAALLHQRILAAESGAKVTITIPGTTPDPKRAAEIEKEMRSIEDRIASQQAESAKYSSGLVKGMLESTIATSKMSFEMLNIELLKAKYGIHWLPTLPEKSTTLDSPKSAPAFGVWRQQVASVEPELDQTTTSLVPTLSNKRFQKSDYTIGVYEDAIWFDISWDTSKLQRPTRAVKGVIVFADLFGEAKFRVRLTIDKQLTPGKPYKQQGIGFKYNRFTDEHQWVRATELADMTVRFQVQEVLYLDGTAEKVAKSD